MVGAEARTHYDYSLRRVGPEVEVTIDRIAMRLARNGKETLSCETSKDLYRIKRKGEWIEVPVDQANARLRRLMQDSHGAPLCRIAVDENGKEVKRTLLARPGARALVASGGIENARLFHAPMVAGRATWSDPGARRDPAGADPCRGHCRRIVVFRMGHGLVDGTAAAHGVAQDAARRASRG